MAKGVEHYARILPDKAAKGWTYGKHYGPHHLDNSHKLLPGSERVQEVARNLGLHFMVVPRIRNKQDAVEAATSRSFAHKASDASTATARNGTRNTGTYKSQPDWARHGSDALQTGACGFVPDYIPPPNDKYYYKPKPQSARAA